MITLVQSKSYVNDIISTRYRQTEQKSYFVGSNAKQIGDVVDDIFHG